MVTDLQVFINPDFGQIRAIDKDGEAWFVAVDVCRALELGNSRKALTRLDDDEKNTVTLSDGNRGNPNVSIVNEPGLYTLVLGSRKPEAKAFRRWVTHEVLPSIRRHGLYITQELLADHEKLKAALEDIKDENLHLALKYDGMLARLEFLQHRVAYHRGQEAKRLMTGIRDTAQVLDIPEHQLVGWLLQRRFLYRKRGSKDLRAYAPYLGPKKDYFRLRATNDDGFEHVQLIVTPMGREYFGTRKKEIMEAKIDETM
ncbi:BRO family protein [Beduinella massiliensis]|uniref:BRO family protein n=1 Tax=Beduinella massiliensis TaxID=1852363 RepID=UPI000C854895